MRPERSDIQLSFLGLSHAAGYLIVGLIASVLYITITSIYALYFHPLSKVPGPKLWVISKLPYVLALRSGRFHQVIHNLHLRYGPHVRVSVDNVYFTDPRAWEDIFSAHANTSRNFAKNRLLFWPAPNGVHGVMSASNDDHPRVRRAIASSFSDRALREQGDAIQSRIRLLVHRLRHEAMEGRTVNLKDWLNFVSFDILGVLMFSESFGCLDNNSYHPWVEALQPAFKLMIYTASLNFFGLASAVARRFAPQSLREKRLRHFKFLQDRVTQRLNEGDVDGKYDFMSSMCRAKGDEAMLASEIEATFSNFTLAGTEGTATTLQAVFLQLLKDRDLNGRVASEVRSKFSDETEMTAEKLGSLDLLTAVIKEAMRLSPATPMTLAREVPDSGATVCGIWLPGKTGVNISPYAMYRMPDNFAEPSEFLVSRWLGEATKSVLRPEAYHPFSVGPRNCIGKQLGWLETRSIVAQLLWNFDMKAAHVLEAWEDQNSWLVWDRHDLKVELIIRED